MPGPIGIDPPAGSTHGLELFYYSAGIKDAADVLVSIAPGMTWDGFWRQVYDRANEVLQRQANELIRQGRVTELEGRALVAARSELLLRIRSRLTPFGQLYSELTKPAATLKTVEHLLAEKGTMEAVLKSVGKTRAVVDKSGLPHASLGQPQLFLRYR